MERSGDRRRNGDTWIAIHPGLGVGLGGPNTHPWNAPSFVSRFVKVATLSSLDDSWREWRHRRGMKTLDVFCEYWRAADEEERIVVRRGRATEVLAYRNAVRLTAAEPAAVIAEREARTVLQEVRAHLGG